MGEFTDKAKGAAKETIGEAKQHSRDPDTRAEGRAQEVDGKADKARRLMKEHVEHIISHFEEFLPHTIGGKVALHMRQDTG